MKKLLLTLIFCTTILILTAQTTHTITAVGTAYTPDSIVVMVGDTIKFDVTNSHPTLEVDMATWNANGTTPLAGGFDYPNGTGSFVVTAPKVYYYVCTAHIAQGMKGRIYVSATVDLKEKAYNEISIYPNPVSHTLNLDLAYDPGIESVTIIDLMGRELMSFELEPGSTSQEFDVEELAPGSYFLIIRNGNTFREVRFVKR